MKTIFTIVSLVILAACAPLSQHDSWLGDTGEVVGRTLLCPVTFCMSEVGFYDKWKREQEQYQYNAWYQAQSPERQALEDQRRHERAIAATQALGMMNFGRPILQYTPPARVMVPNQAPMPQLPTNIQAPSRQGMTCISRVSPYGGQVYTDCN